jgi:excisionase family DNA binding protein
MQLLTATEAARSLRLSSCTLYLYTASGQIQPTRVGKRVLYSQKQIDQFIKAQTRNPRGCRE